MILFTLLVGILATLCAANINVPSYTTVDQVIEDMRALDAAFKTIAYLAHDYKADIPEAVSQLKALRVGYGAVLDMLVDSDGLPPTLPTNDFIKLLVFINDTVVSDQAAAVDALIGEKKDLEAAGMVGLFAPALNLQLQAHNTASIQLVKRTPPDIPPEQLEEAQKIIGGVSQEYEKAIKTFKQSSSV